MPKARVQEVVSDDGTTRRMRVEVGERGTTKTAEYNVPSTAKAFQELVLSASETPDDGAFVKSFLGIDYGADKTESPLSWLHRMFVTSVDRLARAAVYESVAAESTYFSVGKERINIMTFPLKKIIVAVNGMRGTIEARMTPFEAKALTKPESEREAYLAEQRKAVEDAIGYGPWRNAAKRLVNGYTDDEGKAVPAQAKENEASGMLEAIA